MDLILSEATGWYELPSDIWSLLKEERDALWRAYEPFSGEWLSRVPLSQKILVRGLERLTPAEMLYKAGVVDAETGGPIQLEDIVLAKFAPINITRTWIKSRRPYVILPDEE